MEGGYLHEEKIVGLLIHEICYILVALNFFGTKVNLRRTYTVTFWCNKVQVLPEKKVEML